MIHHSLAPIYIATLGPNHPNTQAVQRWLDRLGSQQ